MEAHEQKQFLETLLRIIASEANKIDPENKIDVKEVIVHFTVHNSLPDVQCPAGCFKQSNGKCLCLKTH